jgi:hypothetical protein
MTRKLTELNLLFEIVWVSQKNVRPRRFALVERSDHFGAVLEVHYKVKRIVTYCSRGCRKRKDVSSISR